MCEALDVFEQRGFERARKNALRNLMDSMHWPLEQAMRALKIPASDEEKYRELLANETVDTP